MVLQTSRDRYMYMHVCSVKGASSCLGERVRRNQSILAETQESTYAAFTPDKHRHPFVSDLLVEPRLPRLPALHQPIPRGQFSLAPMRAGFRPGLCRTPRRSLSPHRCGRLSAGIRTIAASLCGSTNLYDLVRATIRFPISQLIGTYLELPLRISRRYCERRRNLERRPTQSPPSSRIYSFEHSCRRMQRHCHKLHISGGCAGWRSRFCRMFSPES